MNRHPYLRKTGIAFLCILLFLCSLPIILPSLGTLWSIGKSADIALTLSRSDGVVRMAVADVVAAQNNEPLPSLGKMHLVEAPTDPPQPLIKRYFSKMNRRQAEEAKRYFTHLPKSFHVQHDDLTPFKDRMGEVADLLETPPAFVRRHETARYILWENHNDLSMPVLDMVFYDNGTGHWRGLYVVHYVWT